MSTSTETIVEFIRPPTGTQLGQLAHVHVKGQCVKRRSGPLCQPAPKVGDRVRVSYEGVVVGVTPVLEHHELKIKVNSDRAGILPYAYVGTWDKSLTIEQVGV